MELVPNIALRAYSTLQVGGTARGLYNIEHDEDVPKAFAEIAKLGAHAHIIGAGSNTYFGDGPHDDLVLVRIGMRGIDVKPSPIEGKLLTAGAGEEWDSLVHRAAKEGVWGLESLAGIPGTVGAAPIQNIGAYGTEVADIIEAVEVYDRKNNEIRGIPNRLCGFGYRKSIFSTTEKDRYVILRVRFWLHQKRRRALPKEVVVPQEGEITPEEVGAQIRAIRDAKLPDHHEFPNCGSFFKNPIVPEARANELLQRYPSMPQYPSLEGIKLSAAWLIEQAGLKGRSWGNVAISPKHALVLTTNGNASATEVERAINEITKETREMFGVELVPEPNFIQ